MREQLIDVDTTAVDQVVAAIERLHGRPLLVAIDGRSGAGKSTIAAAVATEIGGLIVPGDDFYARQISDETWDAMSASERANLAIDWRRLRKEALEPLLEGRTAVWHPFDFAARRPDGTFPPAAPVTVSSSPLMLLDGAYASRPELQDIIGLSVLVEAPAHARAQRLARREEAAILAAWHERWDTAEDFYFTKIRPPASFDLVVRTA